LQAFTLLSRTEGILPALESAHAVAEAVRRTPSMDKEQVIGNCGQSIRPGRQRCGNRGEFKEGQLPTGWILI
jgi:hypothetical protein